jgi:hypothetical protein
MSAWGLGGHLETSDAVADRWVSDGDRDFLGFSGSTMAHRFSLDWRRIVLALVTVTVGLLATVPSLAQAQALPDPDYWEQTTQRKDTVLRLVYSESPQPIPSAYDSVADAAEALRDAERTLPPSNPQARSLWQKVRGVVSRAGLSPPARALGTIALAAGVFEVGWKLGEGLNAKFLRIGVPETTIDPADATWNKISWRAAGSRSYYGANWPEEEGWIASFRYSGSVYERWFEEPCVFSGFNPPEPFVVEGPVASTANCAYGAPQQLAAINVLYGWAPENGLTAPGPIEDFDGQAFSRSSPAPSPPPQATVEQTIENELDDPENNLLRQWLNYQLGSPLETDPTGVGEPNRIDFPEFVEKWEIHRDDFGGEYADELEYREAAKRLVERYEIEKDGRVRRCPRYNDDGSITWFYVDTNGDVVLVDNGKITTMYRPLPEELDRHLERNCSEPPIAP